MPPTSYHRYPPEEEYSSTQLIQSTIASTLMEDELKPIVVLGYPEVTEPVLYIPPPPDPTNPGPVGTINVRTEEVLIVAFVLLLWAAAIALFFNRWGKIRMLEPYQPKFHEEEHRPSCPLVELSNTGIGQHRTSLSKYNVTVGCLDQPTSLYQSLPPAHRSLLRSRQNSVFTGAHAPSTSGTCGPRKTRSAMDINTMDGTETHRTTRRNTSSPMSVANRRMSYAQNSSSASLRSKRSCSLMPTSAQSRRRSCVGECHPIRDRFGYRDSLSPHPFARRTSCAVGEHIIYGSSRERKPSFNNVLTQVTAERRPSSSMLRITNV